MFFFKLRSLPVFNLNGVSHTLSRVNELQSFYNPSHVFRHWFRPSSRVIKIFNSLVIGMNNSLAFHIMSMQVGLRFSRQGFVSFIWDFLNAFKTETFTLGQIFH